jgi:anti-sigma factor RsiW
MSKCEAAEALIVREVDGRLADGEAATLAEHVSACGSCRAKRLAGQQVARALARRTDAPVPAWFAARVSARVFGGEPQGWIDAVNWRRWTEWMLPVAAALLVIAVAVGNRGAATTSGTNEDAGSSTAAASSVDTLAWSGDVETATGLSVLGSEVTSDELLARMLGTASTETEGK